MKRKGLLLLLVVFAFLFTGCGQPEDEELQNKQNIEQPTPTPTPTPTPSDPTVDPAPVVYESQPYDIQLANGYTLHNFMGKKPPLGSEDIVDATDYYAGKAETYIKGLVNDFNQSLKNRPAAQAYFADLITKIQGIDTFFDKRNPKSVVFDKATNTIDKAAQPYFKNIVKSYDDDAWQYSFYYLYRGFANAAWYAGLSTAYQNDGYYGGILYAGENKAIKSAAGMDFKADSEDNYAKATAAMNKALNLAADNMGHDIQANDLRQLMNITLTTNSLKAMDTQVVNNLLNCETIITLGVKSAIDDAIIEAKYAQQNQNQTMGL